MDAVTEKAMLDGVEPTGLGMSLDDIVKSHVVQPRWWWWTRGGDRLGFARSSEGEAGRR